jgi:hypothetical protein
MFWNSLRDRRRETAMEQTYVVLATHGGEQMAFSVHALDEADALAKLAERTAAFDIIDCRRVPPPTLV